MRLSRELIYTAIQAGGGIHQRVLIGGGENEDGDGRRWDGMEDERERKRRRKRKAKAAAGQAQQD
jgi:hypothetical protein